MAGKINNKRYSAKEKKAYYMGIGAGIGFGKYGINARTIINNSFNSTLKRKENCEGNGSGCQRTKNISIDNIKNLYGQQKFICYLKIVK